MPDDLSADRRARPRPTRRLATLLLLSTLLLTPRAGMATPRADGSPTRLIEAGTATADSPPRAVTPKTPDRESDPGEEPERLVPAKLPDSIRVRLSGSAGYSTDRLKHELPIFESDSIRRSPRDLHGPDYLAHPADFTRENLKASLRHAPADLGGELTGAATILDGALAIAAAALGGQSSTYTEGYRNYDAADPDNRAYLIRRQRFTQGRIQERYGAAIEVGYTPAPGSRIALAASGIVSRAEEARMLDDSNYVSTPVLVHSVRTFLLTRRTATASLAGGHALGAFDLRWRAGWSGTRTEQPDQAEWSTSTTLIDGRPTGVTAFSGALRDWQNNDDRGATAGADLSWRGLGELGATISAGGLFRHRSRRNERNVYRLAAAPDQYNHILPFQSIDAQPWDVLNAGGSADFASNNYTSEESVTAGYLMGEWSGGAWRATAGFRAERTDARYTTYDPNNLRQVSASKSYIDLLPGATVRLALPSITPSGSELRLSVGTSIIRPRHYDVVPYTYISGEFRYVGNPELRRSRSTEAELRFETAPKAAAGITAATFFRRIVDPIETVLDLSNPALPTIIPRNLGEALGAGLELAASIRPFELFSGRAGYTYSWSAVTSDKIVNDKNAGRTRMEPETRPMQGEPRHAASLTLGFDDPSRGSSAQLRLDYRGRRLRRVSIYKGFDYYEEPVAMLGAMVGQRIVGALEVTLRAENILGQSLDVRGRDDLPIEMEERGRAVTMSLSYQW